MPPGLRSCYATPRCRVWLHRTTRPLRWFCCTGTLNSTEPCASCHTTPPGASLWTVLALRGGTGGALCGLLKFPLPALLPSRPAARTPRAPSTPRLAKPSTLRPARQSKQQPQQQLQQQQQQQLRTAFTSQQSNQQQQAAPLVATEFSIGLTTLANMFQSARQELMDSGAGADSSAAAGTLPPPPQRTDRKTQISNVLPSLSRAATATHGAQLRPQSTDGSAEIEALASGSGPAKSHLHRALATALERHRPRSAGTAMVPMLGRGQAAGGMGSPPTTTWAAGAGWALTGGEALLPAAPPAPPPAHPASLAPGPAAQLQSPAPAACTTASNNVPQAWSSGGASTRTLSEHLRESRLSGALAQVHEDEVACGPGGGGGAEGTRGVRVRAAGAFGSVSDSAGVGSPRATNPRQGAAGGRLQPGSWLARLRQQSGRAGHGSGHAHVQLPPDQQRTSGDGRLCSVTSIATTTSSAAPNVGISLSAATSAVRGGVELAPLTGDLGTPVVLWGAPAANAGAPSLPLNIPELAAAWGNPLQAVISGQYRAQPGWLPPERASSAPTEAILLPFQQSNDDVGSPFTATAWATPAERTMGYTTVDMSGPGALMYPSESGGSNIVREVMGSPVPLPVAPRSGASMGGPASGSVVSMPIVRTASTRKAQESRTVAFRGLRVRMVSADG